MILQHRMRTEIHINTILTGTLTVAIAVSGFWIHHWVGTTEARLDRLEIKNEEFIELKTEVRDLKEEAKQINQKLDMLIDRQRP